MTNLLTDRDRALIAGGESMARVCYRQYPGPNGVLTNGVVYAAERDKAVNYATRMASEGEGTPWVGEPYFNEPEGLWTVSFKSTKKVAN